MPPNRYLWLVLVFILLPFNLLVEANKWKIIVSGTQKLSMSNCFKAVLSGYSTGFFTPNRTGDMVGRLMFLDSSNRKTGITLCLINSLTQIIIISLCGIPASILFFIQKKSSINSQLINYLVIVIIFIVILFVLFLLLPKFSKSRFGSKISSYIKGLETFSFSKMVLILSVSLIRFIIFSFQLYAMLRFFGVILFSGQALTAIPANYLFITFTPSFAFTEPAIRGSYAVFFFGNYSNHTVEIVLAGVCLWVVNYVISMLFGNIFLVKSATFSRKKKF